MKVLLNSQKRSLRGLTLIELVVVLAILVALVGLVLAFFPGLLSKASKSTSASSIQDVARAVQINYTTSQTYGTGFDSLLAAPSGNALFAKLPSAVAAQLSVSAYPTGDVPALSNLGIVSVRHLNTVANDATFNVTASTTNAISGSINAVTLTDTTVQAAVRGNYTPTGTASYYVYGLGKGTSIVGSNSMLQDAPVRAGSNANENPTVAYARYGLVFLVDDSGTGGTRNARFLGAVAFSSSGITTAESNLQQYYGN